MKGKTTKDCTKEDEENSNVLQVEDDNLDKVSEKSDHLRSDSYESVEHRGGTDCDIDEMVKTVSSKSSYDDDNEDDNDEMKDKNLEKMSIEDKQSINNNPASSLETEKEQKLLTKLNSLKNIKSLNLQNDTATDVNASTPGIGVETLVSLPTLDENEQSEEATSANKHKGRSSHGFNLMKQLKNLKRRATHIVSTRQHEEQRSSSAGNNDLILRTKSAHWGDKVNLHGIRSHFTNASSLRGSPKREIKSGSTPRYVGTSRENVFICECIQLIFQILHEKLQAQPFNDVLLGVSGGETPKKIFKALSSVCDGLHSSIVCSYDDTQNSQESIATRDRNDSSTKHQDDSNKCMEGCFTNLQWNRVKLFLVDERYVPNSHEASNQKMVKECLLAAGSVSIPEENLIFPDTSLPVTECVSQYSHRLKEVLARTGPPLLVTLGIGNDGHLGSWFPPMSKSNYYLSHDPEQLAHHTVQNKGFPIEDRITVSMSLVEASLHKVFFLSSKDKVETWKKVIRLPKEIHHMEQPILQVLDSLNVSIVSCPPVVTDDLEGLQDEHDSTHLSVVIFGASGDLSRKKTIPALFSLFCEGHLPLNTHIIGFARTTMTQEEYWGTIEHHLCNLEYFYKNSTRQVIMRKNSFGFLEEFKKRIIYVSGVYDESLDFIHLQKRLLDLETQKTPFKHANRLFYLALPPSVFLLSVNQAKRHCWSTKGWNRVVIEKPFGRDLNSSAKMSKHLLTLLDEDEIYRIDHYLGKEMVLNLMTFRFANSTFSPLLSWQFVSCVRITFKETIGVHGRASYFDQYGIIRDIMQNHLLQILTVVAMERPASLKDEDIRDEKVKVLKQISSPDLSNTVLGQYTKSKSGDNMGYKDDESVPKDSVTPTFCTTVLHINNERWSGVPFILKAGKALEERRTEIRLQLRNVPGNLFGDCVPQNEIVIQIQPVEAIYMKVMAKRPGLATGLTQTELDFTVMDRFEIERLPEAYERLLLDVIKGDKQNFVRSDELREAWRIFTPLLDEIEKNHVKPIGYPAGSKGPQEAYDLIQKHNYKRYEGYTWDKSL